MAQQNRNGKRGATRGLRGVKAPPTGAFLPASDTSKHLGTPLIIGLGASAGGLDAFKSFFSAMPPQSGFAFVLVQHLDPQHKSLLSELLGKHTEMPVIQVENDMAVEANHVFVIAPNTVLTIADGILRVAAPAPPRERRRPIDTFFVSLAEDQGENAVCIILSGSGSDGTAGLRAIKEHGGLTLAQAGIDETALLGMPSSAAATGLVDYVMPVETMPDKLIDYGNHLARVVKKKDGDGTRRDAKDYLVKICALLRTRLGHDFSDYKDKTLIRRIQRRMQVLQIDNVPAYIERLRKDPAELESLFHDLLIGVTQFFRDPDAFAELQDKIVPKLLEKRDAENPIRVWVPGCATGEEVYSIAMLLREAIAMRELAIPVHLFGTDLDANSVMIARHGRYRKGMAGVSPERLERWFGEEGDDYCVRKDIRDMCIFSVHDLVKDPPFSKLDLISCRNVMIYLNADLQDRLARTFHYALRPGGYLFLGNSESLSRQGQLFTVLDKKYRLFQRRDDVAPVLPAVVRPAGAGVAAGSGLPRPAGADAGTAMAIRIEHHARHALERFSPAYMVINEHHDVLQFSGQIGRYVEPAPGAASFNLFRILKRELQSVAQSAVQEAAKTHRLVVREKIVGEIEGDSRIIDLIVTPISEPADGLLVIAFQDHGPIAAETSGTAAPAISAQTLDRELHAVRAQLQTTIDELATANEELKSSNEEYQSVNEELQSTNEELETSKEELTSINEELQTINSELGSKNEALNRANSDLKNLLDSTQIATLFLDSHLRIKNFTPPMSEIFPVRDGDRGRPITEIVTRLLYDDLQRDVKKVLRTLSTIEREVTGITDDAAFLMRIRPYRTVDDVIDGVVLTFVDITERKRRENESARLAAIVTSSQDPIMSVSPDGEIVNWNPAAEKLFGLKAGEVIGKKLSAVIPEGGIHEVPLLEKVRRGGGIQRYEIERPSGNGGSIRIAFSLFPIVDSEAKVISVGMIAHDISERRRQEEYQGRLAAIVASSDDAIVSKNLDGIIMTWNSGAEHLFGYTAEEAIGQSIRMLLPPDRHEEEDEILALIRKGKRFENHDTIRLRKDGTQVDISLTVSPIRDTAGRVIGASKIARDITERRRAEAFQKLMTDELNHRVKNTLTTVQSIAAQSLQDIDVDPRFREVFESRLIALSKVHDLLTRDNWDGASLRELLLGELDPYRARDHARIAIEGPDVRLPPKAAVALGMAFHELATNAGKYGALSNESGRIAVTWNIDGASPEALQMKWTESGGPPVQPPRRRGFGSRLIERGLSLELNGHARLEFEPSGVSCVIEMPVPRGGGMMTNVR